MRGVERAKNDAARAYVCLAILFIYFFGDERKGKKGSGYIRAVIEILLFIGRCTH